MSSWVVYSRVGCHLCEDFLAELASLIGERAADVRVMDVDSDPALNRKYSERIPVLTIDDDFVCAYRVDVERVRRYLAAERR